MMSHRARPTGWYLRNAGIPTYGVTGIVRRHRRRARAREGRAHQRRLLHVRGLLLRSGEVLPQAWSHEGDAALATSSLLDQRSPNTLASGRARRSIGLRSMRASLMPRCVTHRGSEHRHMPATVTLDRERGIRRPPRSAPCGGSSFDIYHMIVADPSFGNGDTDARRSAARLPRCHYEGRRESGGGPAEAVGHSACHRGEVAARVRVVSDVRVDAGPPRTRGGRGFLPSSTRR